MIMLRADRVAEFLKAQGHDDIARIIMDQPPAQLLEGSFPDSKREIGVARIELRDPTFRLEKTAADLHALALKASKELQDIKEYLRERAGR